MNTRILSAIVFGSSLLLLDLSSATPAHAGIAKGSVAGQCEIGSALSTSKSPLVGLWRVSGYREINGEKRYASPGDAVLIVPTSNAGEVCVEFTLPVEGSQHYYLAIEPDGMTIDETVYTEYGGELRIIIRYRSDSSVNFVLYNRPLTSMAAVKGGPDEGGAVGELQDWD